jgi:zinc D-Ala-D-Ala dipeptidase
LEEARHAEIILASRMTMRSPQHRERSLVGSLWQAMCAAVVTAALFVCVPAALAADAATERLNTAGLVEPILQDKTLVLDIRYATTNNFTGQKVYPSARCFLRDSVSKKLGAVQTLLRRQGLGLKVYDCYRPFSVQELFWRIMPDERYVLEPVRNGGTLVKSSRHNRGAAVDVTLVDGQGSELPMPTGYDDFTDAAHRDSRKASLIARRNSAVLEQAMRSQGFIPLPTEWWHFDAPGWESSPPLDLPLPTAQ